MARLVNKINPYCKAKVKRCVMIVLHWWMYVWRWYKLSLCPRRAWQCNSFLALFTRDPFISKRTRVNRRCPLVVPIKCILCSRCSIFCVVIALAIDFCCHSNSLCWYIVNTDKPKGVVWVRRRMLYYCCICSHKDFLMITIICCLLIIKHLFHYCVGDKNFIT